MEFQVGELEDELLQGLGLRLRGDRHVCREPLPQRDEDCVQRRIDPAGIRDHAVLSAPDGTLLVFGLAAPLSGELPTLVANDEVSELTILLRPERLAFSLHTQVVDRYFARR